MTDIHDEGIWSCIGDVRTCTERHKKVAHAANMIWYPDLYERFAAAMSGSTQFVRLRFVASDIVLNRDPGDEIMRAARWKRAVTIFVHGKEPEQ